MIGFIYKWTRTNGEYYIGQHLGHPDDGYIGSGTVFIRKYNKYPEQFSREILCTCENLRELNRMEAYAISNCYEEDALCLNLKGGGDNSNASAETKKRQSESQAGIMNPSASCEVYRWYHFETDKTELGTFSSMGYKYSKRSVQRLSNGRNKDAGIGCGFSHTAGGHQQTHNGWTLDETNI